MCIYADQNRLPEFSLFTTCTSPHKTRVDQKNFIYKEAKPEKKLHCKWSEERKQVGSDNHAQKMRSFDKSYNFLILDYYKLQRSLLLYNNYSSLGKYLRILKKLGPS